MDAKVFLTTHDSEKDPPILRLDMDSIPRLGEILVWDALGYVVNSIEWQLILKPPQDNKFGLFDHERDSGPVIECEVVIHATTEAN